MAHEIRNPLNFINLSIDHVRERLAPAEPSRRQDFDRILANVKAEVLRLNRLVGDFLSFGKPMRLDTRPCGLDEVLREVASLVEHKARDQAIAIDLEAEPGLPRILADPELLKTCFLNLMINALDAMPDGGALTVTVRRRGHDADRVLGYGERHQARHDRENPGRLRAVLLDQDTGFGLGLP